MAGGFCEHKRIWTTCPECGGKAGANAPLSAPKPAEDDWAESSITIPGRPEDDAPPPDEPPETKYEHHHK